MHKELNSARALALHLSPIAHRTIEILGFSEISRSARTKEELIEFDRIEGLAEGYVPSAYPPGRDFTFLSLAAAWAETLILAKPEAYEGANIVIGTNKTDSLDYPDCQPEVYRIFGDLLRHSLKMCKVLGKSVNVEAPLVALTKQEVVALGHRLGVPLHLTWSCYQGGERACGRCDACRIRYHAFEVSGLHDPIRYEIETISPLRVGCALVAVGSA
jgi:7-cyano-7-deazaguanine synthase